MISIIVSGKESLKFLKGLLHVISPEKVNVIVDTFNFFDYYGIKVYPELTNVFLLLMDQLDEHQWSGVGDATTEISNFLQKVDDDSPFIEKGSIGDLFLAPNIFITHCLQNNLQLSTSMEKLAKNFTEATILPLSNDELKLDFRSIKQKVGRKPIEEKYPISTLFEKFESITLLPEVEHATSNSEVVLFPKLPVSSILAFLKILHFKETLKNAIGQIIFISPLSDRELDPVTHQAFQAAGLQSSSIGLTKVLRGLVDVYIIDTVEESIKNRITRFGMKIVSHPLNLDSYKNQLNLIEFVLKLTPFRDVVESLDYKTKKEIKLLKQGLRKMTKTMSSGFKRLKTSLLSGDDQEDEIKTDKESEDTDSEL